MTVTTIIAIISIVIIVLIILIILLATIAIENSNTNRNCPRFGAGQSKRT